MTRPGRIALRLAACVAAAPALGAAAGTGTAAAADPVVAAAGDIVCRPGQPVTATKCRQRFTARLLAPANRVLALGDLQYEDGTLAAFRRRYAQSWGRYRRITWPVPGNHEYHTPGAAGYFAYFGRRARPNGRGYYTHLLGRWRVIALDSNCDHVGGCGTGSAQYGWLRRVLTEKRRRCVLAFSHHPRFSSGAHGPDRSMGPMWRLLHRFGADLLVSGHDHHYERFAKLGRRGRPDDNGMRQFVVGTGGRSLRPIGTARHAGSRAVRDDRFGVLRLRLRPRSYGWRFVVPGGAVSDHGRDICNPR